MTITYGQHISWRPDRYSIRHIEVSGYATVEEACQAGLECAYEDGWTRPRWWQWWRWGDKDYEAILRKHIETMSAITQKLPD